MRVVSTPSMRSEFGQAASVTEGKEWSWEQRPGNLIFVFAVSRQRFQGKCNVSPSYPMSLDENRKAEAEPFCFP